jgi:hypothetical protein
MNFKWFEAAGLFILWSSQIYFQYDASHVILPFAERYDFAAVIWDRLHAQVLVRYTYIYWGWIAIQLIGTLIVYRRLPVISNLKAAWAARKGRQPIP